MTESFGERLALAVLQKKNPVCVGLDPRLAQLPTELQVSNNASAESKAEAYLQFCKVIIDCTADLVPAVKPQSAFFEELGPHGLFALEQTTRYASSKGLIVIMDAKRGDIGTTAQAYANAYLGSGLIGSDCYSPFGADALTVNAFLGADTIEPFVERSKTTRTGLFVLVKTSNPGSAFLQDLQVGNTSISERVAVEVQRLAALEVGTSGFGSIGAVVGATYPQQLQSMREQMPNAWILVPGYGAQGGSAKDVRLAIDAKGLGALINSSRGIIFAYENKRFQGGKWHEAVRRSTLDMIESIDQAARRN